MKPPKKTNLDREFWKRDAKEKRQLAARIAYHERRLKEEQAKQEKR